VCVFSIKNHSVKVIKLRIINYKPYNKITSKQKMNSSSASTSIQIESKKYLINIPSYDMTCKQFMKLALEQTKNDFKNGSYALFECSNGIERLINKNDNISNLLMQINDNYELILRKCHSIEKKLQIKQQKSSTVKAYYKKAKYMINKENNFHEIEKKYQEKFIKTEEKLNKSTKMLMESNIYEDLSATKSKTCSVNHPNLSKLCKYHRNQLNEMISEKYKDNVTFLKFLHMKLIQQNMNINNGESSKKNYESSDSGRHTDELIGSNGCSRSNSLDDIENSNELAYETWV
jgi:hypothetical protein